MKKLYLVIFLTIGSLTAFAQDDMVFTADRPGTSTGPSTVTKGVIQLEQGIQYDANTGTGTFTFSNTLLRYGLFPNMELRLGGDAFLYPKTEMTKGYKATFSGLGIGTKIKCFEGDGAIPAVSVLGDFSVPYTASKGFNVDHLAPSLYLLFENPINDRLSIGYNLGAEWDGTSPQPTTFTALCFGFSATENLGCFLESYNYFSTLGNVYAMDLGINWMLAPKIQLDLAANMNLNNPVQCWAISCGIAWQINK